MKDNIHPSIQNLAIDIENLLPMEKNPRSGNVDAIVASYSEFGQMRPIVAKKNDDGTFTVIAGNHQLQAAKKLGWTSLAVVVMDESDEKAIAFALADNRTSELGATDQSIILELLDQVGNEYHEMFLELGWDDFEMASMTVEEKRSEITDNRGGYIAPVIVNPFEPTKEDSSIVEVVDGEDTRLEATKEVDASEAMSRGSTAVGIKGGEKAVVQYTLVFDDADQQRRWYDFIRFIRNDPQYVGETTASKLIDFINSNADF